MFKIKFIARRQTEILKEQKADLFASKCIPRRALNAWKQYVSDKKEEKWREFRKERLRSIAKEQLSQFSTLS